MPPPEVIDRALVEDFIEFSSLVRKLDPLNQRWLPRMLRFEFQRCWDQGSIEITFPPDFAWENGRGRAPKNGTTHSEDLEQYVMWYYRRKIKRPSDSMARLAREWVDKRRAAGITRTTEAESVVRGGIKRIQTLFACINAPLPT